MKGPREISQREYERQERELEEFSRQLRIVATMRRLIRRYPDLADAILREVRGEQPFTAKPRRNRRPRRETVPKRKKRKVRK